MAALMTRQEMQEKLGRVFASEQTDSLVEVLDTIRQVELERAADTRDLKRGLATLTEEVKKLAVAQRQTDERVGELAVAQRQTDERLGELAVAQRQTDERLAELAVAQRQTNERVAELAVAQRQTDERLGELAAAQRQTNETVAQLGRSVDDLVIGMTRLRQEVGGLSNRFGFSLEEFVAALLPPYLERHKGLSGLTLERSYFDLGDGREEEVDLVGTGRRDGKPTTVLVECRTTIRGGEVQKLARKLEGVAASITTGEVAKVVVAMHVHPSAEMAAQETGMWVVPYSRINRERA